MNQISLADADSLISKLLTERIPVLGHFISSSGAEARIDGFIDSKNSNGTVVISTSGPPLKTEQGFFRFWLAGHRTSIWYGESREISDELRPLAERVGNCALIFNITEFNEKVLLFFSVD
jgi:hypothetical protein